MTSTRRRLASRVRRAVRPSAPAEPAAPTGAGFGRPDTGWVRAEANPTDPQPLDDVPLFAILCTWMEADIVAATVANALAQGCERVYLVDNDSPDATVAVAEAAGATLARSFTTERFEEQARFDVMHEVVDEMSRAEASPQVWWLWIDADELPQGTAGRTIAGHLATLDRRYRVVGGRVFNHYPTPGQPPTPAAADPLAEQPLCEEARWPFCALEHHKHPLLRWDRAGPPIRAGLGFHQATSTARPLLEPVDAVAVHHVPFRAEADARRRLDALLGPGGGRARPDDDATDHMRARFASLDAVYAGDWPKVANHMTGGLGVRPRAWTELVAEDTTLAEPRDAQEPDP